jgi:PAS domain S-box-containing protein
MMKDAIQLDSIVNEVKYDEEILYAVIFNENGEAVTSQFASINYKSPRIIALRGRLQKISDLPIMLDFILENEASEEISLPVVVSDETVGVVVVCISKHNMVTKIIKTITVIILFNIFTSLILAATLFAVSRRIIFTPLNKLTEASKTLARGDLTTRVETVGTGEMQLLIDNFNQMADDLQQTTVSREYFDDIIKSMSEALYILSPDRTIRDVNSAACLQLGYGREELIGRDIGTLFSTDLLSGLSEKMLKEQSLRIETESVGKDGALLPVFLTVSAMTDKGGRYQGIICNALDISEIKKVSSQLAATNRDLLLEMEQRKEAQEEAVSLNEDLERQRLALVASNKELDAFAYSVSHDLRAPLRGVDGFSHALLDEYADKLDETGKDYINRIRKGCVRMGRLIDDLLQLSRIARSELNRIPVDLSRMAEQVIATLQMSEPGREIEVHIDSGMAANADLTLIRSVVENLLGNAWKFTRNTVRPLIQFSLFHENGAATYCVKDNGAGFNMEYANKLFTAFQRLHRQDEFEGTGIGLASVQRVISMHGGKIRAEGEEGKGAAFYFTLGDSET